MSAFADIEGRAPDAPAPGARAPAARCAHCGLRVPRALVRADDAAQFCCDGCRAVHALLRGWGYDEYYRLKASDDGSPLPARVSGRSFEDFDDPSFAAEYVEDGDDGGRRVQLYLEGVHCAACVWLVEHLPRRQPGLRAVRLDLARSQATLEWDPGVTRLSAVARALDAVGHTPHPYRVDALARLRKAEDRSLLLKLGVAAACAMNILFIQATLYAGEATGIDPAFETFFRWIGFVLAAPVALWAARPFYVGAWSGLRQRVPHMDLPISIALVVAFGYSAIATVRGVGPIYFDSLTALVALLLGARYVQIRAQRAAVERSEGLRSASFVEFARRLEAEGGSGEGKAGIAREGAVRDEVAREVAVGSLAVGDRVEVRSGELIPADGRVVSGRSTVDNAVLTGEATPVPVAAGDTVNAGATNLGARLVVVVEATGPASRVGALLRLVDQALAAKAPIVRMADRLSRGFVTAVIALAAITGTVWLVLDSPVALERVVALLVVTCPCALGLATPVAMTVALSRAARRGVFVKDADVIERMRSVRTALLDKTGTLTRGTATVVGWEGDPDALAPALALEAHSTHPVAAALRAAFPQVIAAAGGAAAGGAVTDVVEVAGRGIAGRVDGRSVVVGNAAHVEATGGLVDAIGSARAAAFVEGGASPTFVAIDGTVRAVVGVGDSLRPEAPAVVAAMKARGWHPRILSGDHPELVRALAARVGIAAEDALGGLTPEAKRDHVLAATARGGGSDGARVGGGVLPVGGGVLMVGDGVNDAAALAAADVGVSVHGGTAASIVAADVVLTRGGLEPLLELAEGARGTLRVIHRNLGFSLVYNLAGAALAVTGLVGPLVAAVLMPASSLTVILSSVVGRPFRPARRVRENATRALPHDPGTGRT